MGPITGWAYTQFPISKGADMRPGNTKNITLSDGWQRFATLCGSSDGDFIASADGTEKANQIWLSATTYAAEISFAVTMPSINGHPMAVGDSITFGNMEFIKRAWMRNGTAGSNSVVIVTPIYE
jgi:hypothetical protein